MKKSIIKGNIVDIISRKIFPGEVTITGKRIHSVVETGDTYDNFLLPGFVDAHVHVESSMVTPIEFSRMAVRHGTVAVVADPHEIANVSGIPGVRFMVEDGKKSPLKFLFGAPSCVPATPFESSGASIDAEGIKELLSMEGVGFLAEMMNFPGVVHDQKDVLQKIKVARKMGMNIDGHAPGLKGEDLKKYCRAGISTDHECVTVEEAEEKIKNGMHILIREGSGAKNFMSLVPLLKKYPERIMFCTDDSHPDDLLDGHINKLVKKALDLGYDLFDVLRAASLNAKKHYRLNIGMLQPGDPADFIIVNNLRDMKVRSCILDGKEIFDGYTVKIERAHSKPVNNFVARTIEKEEIRLKTLGDRIKVIKAADGSLITEQEIDTIDRSDPFQVSCIAEDRLKLVVVNRYRIAPPSVGFIRGFGLKKGAIASSIAHDSHNVICVGTEDDVMVELINWIFRHKGGIALHDGQEVFGMPLPHGGIMSDKTLEDAAKVYRALSDRTSLLGSTLYAPFMTLSFMSLLVIPELKLGDKGLFDVNRFAFTPLFAD
ncbi:MAG: adenine deaminase [Bacteroidales bacterium]|nr:adenine deaminase [Bacteroidales bacterium]MBN2699199.1 adenine deaminase [Bacteroidales bacterium]